MSYIEAATTTFIKEAQGMMTVEQAKKRIFRLVADELQGIRLEAYERIKEHHVVTGGVTEILDLLSEREAQLKEQGSE